MKKKNFKHYVLIHTKSVYKVSLKTEIQNYILSLMSKYFFPNFLMSSGNGDRKFDISTAKHKMQFLRQKQNNKKITRVGRNRFMDCVSAMLLKLTVEKTA